MTTRRSLDYLMETATSVSPSWTNRELIYFHYHNPNGAAAAFRGMSDTIRDYVNQDIIPAGWHIAYGSLNDYHINRLMDMQQLKLIKSIPLEVVIEGLENATENGYNKLASFILGEQL